MTGTTSEYLVEIQAHNGTSVVTLRFSVSGYTTAPTDVPADTTYDAAIQDPSTFEQRLWAQGKTFGLPEAGHGEIVLVNVAGRLDYLATGYSFDGRTVVVKRLDTRRSLFSSAEVITRGTVEGVDTNQALTTFRLRLYDRRLDIMEPIQLSRYGGTTINGGIAGHLADGTADMKDKVKPLAYGTSVNVVPVPVNPFDLIFQVHDGAVLSMVAYDGGIALTNGGNFASVAALAAVSAKGGKFYTCLALGLLRVGREPAFALTVDVVEGTTAAARSSGAIVQRMLSKMGLTGSANVNAASFAALQAAAPQECGITISEERPGLDVMTEVLASVGAAVLPGASGAFEVARLAFTTPSWSLVSQQILEEDVRLLENPDTAHAIPAYRIELSYAPVGLVQTGEMLCDGVPAARKSLVGADVRIAAVESATVKTKYLLSEALRISTRLVSAANAATEAARRATLYSVQRQMLEFDVLRSDAVAAVLGSTGTLSLPDGRYGYTNRQAIVIGRYNRPADEQVTLTVWG